MIHFLPIENLKERYTIMYNDIISKYFDYVYYPNMEDMEISKGEFLDIEKTIKFKTLQLSMVADAFTEGKVKDGDVFFVADIFFPGIESIKYMSELQNIKIEIVGYNHAGRADENDFIRKLNSWSDKAELTYMSVCDRICVGSEYHKELICKYFNMEPSKVYVTGPVWDMDYAFNLYPHLLGKKNQIVFPHRLSDEKGVDDLIKIVSELKEHTFVITSSRKLNNPTKKYNQLYNLPNVILRNGLTKTEYYQILSESKFYLSCAKQETFGYTLREALLYKCIPVVPNRVAYMENLPTGYRYDSIDEAILMIKTLEQTPDVYWIEKHNKNVEKILDVIYDRKK